MKVACAKVLLVISVGFSFTSTAIAQFQPTNSPQPSIPASSSSSQQDSFKVIVRDEVDRLKRDNKEALELYIKDKVNEKVTTYMSYVSLFFALLAAIFGGAAGLVLAKKWKQQFKKEYIEAIKEEVAKQLEVEVKAELESYLRDAKQKSEEITSLKIYIEEYHANLSNLEADFNAQMEKHKIIQKLSLVIPPENKFFKDQTTSKIQERLRELTSELTKLKSKYQSLDLTFEDHIKWGDALYYSENFKEAEVQYGEAIKLQPKAYKALFGEGNALRKQGEYGRAYESYQKAIAANPDYIVAYIHAGLTKRRLLGGTIGLEEGIKCFEDAIDIEPSHYRAWYNKACYFAVLEKPEQALKYLEEAIKRAPRHCRKLAKDDVDFKYLRENEKYNRKFEELIEWSID